MDTADLASQSLAMQQAQMAMQMQTSMAKIAHQADQAVVSLLSDSVQATKMQAAAANQVKGGVVA